MRTATLHFGGLVLSLFALIHCGGGPETLEGDDAREAAPSSAATTMGASNGAPAIGSTNASTPPSIACLTDTDCDDHDACTIDRCVTHREGEFAKHACEHVASSSCGQGQDAGAPNVDAAPPSTPTPTPSCSPLAGTLSTMHVVQGDNAIEAFRNVWCCIGRLNECSFPVGTCIAGQITQTQAFASEALVSVGSQGTRFDDDAVYAVRCDATVVCRIQCDGSCVPETCH